MGVHTVVFGHSRYHVPLVPIMVLYGVALLMHARTLDLRERRPAALGALVSMALLGIVWARQLFVVEADKIKALFGYGA
jgi:hypothetical protein